MLRRNEHKIEGFSWITYERKYLDRANVSNSLLTDTSTLFKSNNYRYYGITPELFETVNPTNRDLFLSVHLSSYPGFKNLGECLYTRAGSQGLGLSTYDSDQSGVDPLSSSTPSPFLYHIV